MGKPNSIASLAAGFVIAAASSPGVLAGTGTENGQPFKVLVKEVIKCGTWVTSNGVTFTVTPQRIDGWVASFDAMQAEGIKVPIPDDHLFTANGSAAAHNYGWVIGMFRDGDSMKAAMKFIGTDALLASARNDVSIYVPKSIKRGNGSVFTDAIEHICLTPIPQIPGLGDFAEIAASAGGQTQVPVLRLAENTMNPLQQIAQALGIDASQMDDAAILAAVLQKVTGNTASLSAAKADKDALAASREQVRTLEAARGKPIDVDPDAIIASVDAITLQLDSLVDKKCVTKAVRDDLAAVLLGTPDNRPVLCLSHKAATAAGFPGSLAKLVIGALLKNDGKSLALAAGEATKRQSIALSRETPGGDAKDDVMPQAEIDERAKRMYGKTA